MRKTKLNQAIAVVILLLISNVALAIDGRTAVGMCIDSTAGGARCEWSVNDKGEVDICNASGCVYCPSAEGQCTVAKNRSRPTHAFPEGVEVITPIGRYKVQDGPCIDKLIAEAQGTKR